MKGELLAQYGVLIAILAGGIVAFYYTKSDTVLQFSVGVITSVAYVIWGLIYHSLKKDLHIKVVIEYVLMATIAIVILATVLMI